MPGLEWSPPGDEPEPDERTRRAWTEPMDVRALGDGRYAVRSAGGTYTIDMATGRCTCPDHRYRDLRCKHLRRVEIEITAGRVPPPGQTALACPDCVRDGPSPAGPVRNWSPPTGDNDGPAFGDGHDGSKPDPDHVGLQATDGQTVVGEGPVYCAAHEIGPGDLVVDRETGDRLVVVARAPLPATAVRISDRETTVAAHPTNERYSGADPVVGAIYPHASIDPTGPTPDHLRIYVFPRTRLSRVPTAHGPVHEGPIS